MTALEGRTVVVTRSADRVEELAALLRERGAVPLPAPAIRIEPVPEGGPLDEAITDVAMRGYAWVVFTSGAGVDAWFARAAELGVDARALNAKVAAVGSGTSERLRDHGIESELVPPEFTTASLAETFPEGREKVLLARADIATPELEESLRGKGWQVTRVDAYRTIPADELPEAVAQALGEGRVDAVTFTSRSTVQGFTALAEIADGPLVACIGPVTADAARAAGLRVDAVASPHTLEGLVEALERAFASR
ncbi:MAG TPA: uroporphyrinogen-III synthase [Actinomycetota bacterium]